MVHDGTALLALEVGFGKTAAMVAVAMERKRLGLTDKPIFVVPKATHDWGDTKPGDGRKERQNDDRGRRIFPR